MTAVPAPPAAAGAPRIKPKWRPSIAMVVFAALMIVMALPLVGLFFFRIYENGLVRQTEGELIAQCAILAAMLEHELATPAADGAQRVPPASAAEGPYHPIEPSLDLAAGAIRGPRPDARPPSQPPDPALLAIGRRMQAVIAEAQKTTLAGFRILDSHGTVIAGREEVGLSLAHVDEVKAALHGQYRSVLRVRELHHPPPPLYSVSRGTEVRVFAAMPVVVGADVVGVIYASRTPTNIVKHLYGEHHKVIAAAATVVGATLLIGFVFWRTITRPMHALIRQTQTVGRAGRAALSPLRHHGTRELALLSQSFLDMAERLYDRTDYITTFAAHVSHELKSPLTSIQGAAELLRDAGNDMSDAERQKFLDNVVADTRRLTALVDRLRELARADNPRLGQSTTLTSVVATLRGPFSRLAIVAEGDLDRELPISLDNASIVFSHLADNAVRHHATTLRICAVGEAASVSVIVANDGEAIAPNNREKIFTPFFTTRRETGGTGMGLEIVRSMLRAHGGSIRLLPGDDGAAFEIRLPAA